MSRLLWLLMLAWLLMECGCEQKPAEQTPAKVTSEDVLRDAGQAAKTAAEFSRQTKEEFQKALEARLQELDAEIVKLRGKGGDLKNEAKANWDQEMIELETKRDAARAKLAEVGGASAEAWKDVQKGAQSAWDELEKAFHDAAQEF
jgi:TolA-binding protein